MDAVPETIRIGHDFFDRARARLTLDVPAALHDFDATGPRGDLDLDPSVWERVGRRATRPAAVLIAVVDHAEPSVILTMRTPDLRSHAGQISFPGGKIDATDASPLAAALREADEEIGLQAELVDPIGYLDLYLTFSGYRILPTVAQVSPDFALTLNKREVDEAFEVPLSFLMVPQNHQWLSRDWQGMTRHYYAMPYKERYIWGVTAGILRNLYERIYQGMIRTILTEAVLFIAPFAAYALFLWATRAGFLDLADWTPRRLLVLGGVSLALMAASLFFLIEGSSGPPHSTYVPAHMENGRLVPGSMQ